MHLSVSNLFKMIFMLLIVYFRPFREKQESTKKKEEERKKQQRNNKIHWCYCHKLFTISTTKPTLSAWWKIYIICICAIHITYIILFIIFSLEQKKNWLLSRPRQNSMEKIYFSMHENDITCGAKEFSSINWVWADFP